MLQLPKIKLKEKKRVGRGPGSGKGKTAGRGTKGQKARDKIPHYFTGGGLALYRKLPLLRGWGNRPIESPPIPLKVSALNVFKSGTEVDLDKLLEKKLVDEKEVAKRGVKILDGGELKVALTVKLPASAAARQKIEQAGGKVIE